jgi:ubiquinone biosynthesis protein
MGPVIRLDKSNAERRPTREGSRAVDDAVDAALARWNDRVAATPSGSAAPGPPPNSRERRGRRPAASPAPAVDDGGLEYIEQLLSSPLGRAWVEDSSVTAALPPPQPTTEGVVASLPRRKVYAPSTGSLGVPSMATSSGVSVSSLRVLSRLFVWTWGYLRFYLGSALDALLGRSSLSRSATRFRLILESLGSTFIKLGQQLAVRADMLPYEYCEELSKMLDRVQPFPAEQAIAIIERRTGKRIGEIFEVFDPTPIGSASLACVYQAILKGGEKVAVKVRRPGIRETLAADLRAFSLLTWLAELLSFLRSGTSKNLRYELSGMLLEETDFRREARFTEIFRLEAERNGQSYITAPRVYAHLSSDEVLVTEFVSGVFLSEVLSVMDRGDQETLAMMRSRGIHPEEVARRLVMAFNWETMENVLFHADPHPANIVVKPDNSLVFIDFGSCGRFGSKTKRQWRQFHYYLANEDVAAMTDIAVAMLEPLPPIDLDAFKKEVELLYWDWLYAMKSDTSEWWEKASGVMWMKFIAVSRRYRVPINLDTLKGLRVTFLFDTIVFRLDRELDLSKEYGRYAKDAGKRARKRVTKALRRRALRGPGDNEFVAWEELGNMGEQMKGRIQHFLDSPRHNFMAVIDKAYYGLMVLLQAVGIGIALHLVLVLIFSAYNNLSGRNLSLWSTITTFAKHPLYQLVPLAVILIAIRKVLDRVSDPDVRNRN